MTALIIAIAALFALTVAITIEQLRLKRAPAARPRDRVARPRRLPHVEDDLRPAIDEARERFGQIFDDHKVWRFESQTRLELTAADRWVKLNDFSRNLVVRHLWRALEKIADGGVVVIDLPPQTWDSATNARFRDRGIDPWRFSAFYKSTAPQYIKQR